MGKAMNRSLTNVLFGAFGSAGDVSEPAASGRPAERAQRYGRRRRGDARLCASKVIVVPGYGMAVAQAQHA